MWTFDVNDVTQNNIYGQLLAMLCVFLPSSQNVLIYIKRPLNVL